MKYIMRAGIFRGFEVGETYKTDIDGDLVNNGKTYYIDRELLPVLKKIGWIEKKKKKKKKEYK